MLTTSDWSLDYARKRLDKELDRKKFLDSSLKEEKKCLLESKEKVTAVQEGQEILQEIAKQMQHEAHKQVAKIVSKCLSAVFHEPYELRIEFERKRGKTEAEFVYLRAGRKVSPKLTSGGVLEVASLALRLTSLVMTLPPARKLLVLDEPFLALSSVNMSKMAILIESLSSELGVQFIICTHSQELCVGKVIRI